jgi:starch phosphorylase
VSDNGIPLEWVRLMKETMKSNAAHFSFRRMAKEFVEEFYTTNIQKVIKDQR